MKKKVKNKYLLGVSALAIIAILGISMVVAFPSGIGFGEKQLSDEERTVMEEQMQAIQTAIADEDFETWKSLMESQLTEENFEKLVEEHKSMTEMKAMQDELQQAVEDGDTEKAEELKAELYDLMPQGNFERGHFFSQNPPQKPSLE